LLNDDVVIEATPAAPAAVPTFKGSVHFEILPCQNGGSVTGFQIGRIRLGAGRLFSGRWAEKTMDRAGVYPRIFLGPPAIRLRSSSFGGQGTPAVQGKRGFAA
jgi:hypothetical protein